jgi:hypothetical protein
MNNTTTTRGPVADYFIGFIKLQFLFAVFPFGILSLISGRLIYHSWSQAFIVYLLGLMCGISAALGTIPILGVIGHWWLTTEILIPNVAAIGVGESWLTDLLAASASTLAAACWMALFPRVASDRPAPVDNRRELARLGIPAPVARTSRGGPSLTLTLLVVAVGLALVVYLYRTSSAAVIAALFTVISAYGLFGKHNGG